MSGGGRRERTRKGLAPRVRMGAGDKPARHGLPVLPEEVWPVLDTVLAARGWRGLLVLVCLCRLSATDALECRVINDTLIVPGGQRYQLLPVEAQEVQHFLSSGIQPVSAKILAHQLNGPITREVRRLLVDKQWARHVRITIDLLHHEGDRLALAAFGDRTDFLRAYRRSDYVHPEDMAALRVEETMNAADDSLGRLMEEAVERLDPCHRAVLHELLGGDS